MSDVAVPSISSWCGSSPGRGRTRPRTAAAAAERALAGAAVGTVRGMAAGTLRMALAIRARRAVRDAGRWPCRCVVAAALAGRLDRRRAEPTAGHGDGRDHGAAADAPPRCRAPALGRRQLERLQRLAAATKPSGSGRTSMRLAGQLLDVAQVDALVVGAEREGDALGAGARGAADAVDILLGHVGQVVIDDVADARDVDPARGDVGRDQHLDAGPT